MIIDAHAHVDESERLGWRDTPEKLIRLMDGAEIAKTVVTTYADTPGPEDALDRLAGWVADHPDRFIGFPRMDPRWGDEALDAFEHAVRDRGMGGLKLHPVSNSSNPFGTESVAMMDLAADLDVPVLIHAGDRAYCLPHQIGEAADRTDATILMGHTGGYFNAADAVPVARAHDNVILESSAFPHVRVLERAAEAVGAEQVIYGSDMPPANPHVELEKVLPMDVTDEERERILWRNAAELMDVDVEEGAA